MVAVGAAHVSVSRGALPFVVPSGLTLDAGRDLALTSEHPTVIRGAERHDIAAVQVDVPGDLMRRYLPTAAVQDAEGSNAGADAEASWSVTATGPLMLRHGRAVLAADEMMIITECLSSSHGHLIDPLLRSGLTPPA